MVCVVVYLFVYSIQRVENQCRGKKEGFTVFIFYDVIYSLDYYIVCILLVLLVCNNVYIYIQVSVCIQLGMVLMLEMIVENWLLGDFIIG